MDTAILTLWTPKEVVAAGLDMSRISVVGQLYSKRGINFVIRNVLANPRLRKLYILGNDLSASGESFLTYNFDLDKNIDPEAFNAFKQSVNLIDNRKITAKVKIFGQKSEFWRKPEIFKEEEPVLLDTHPSEFSNIVIRQHTVSAAWIEVLRNLLKFGVFSKPVLHYDNGGKSTLRELLNLVVDLTPISSLDDEVSKYMPFSSYDVSKYVESFLNREKGDDDYTYGERLFDYDGFDQIKRMTEKLKGFPQDKGALCVLWKPKIDSFPNYESAYPKRVPCLTLIQGQIWLGKLYLTAYFRSNDMGSAWPLNAYALRFLQNKLAKELNVVAGSLTTISNMAQLYERDYAMAEKVVSEQTSRPNCTFDPRGNLIIRVENDLIKVKHIAPNGITILNEFEQRGSILNSAQILGDKIISSLAISQISHAMDIGRQLARAEEAARRGLVFTQDAPLPV